MPLGSSALSAAGGLDIRDGWDNEEWGSLEEEPVSKYLYLIFI